jgi:hypothetical protein
VNGKKVQTVSANSGGWNKVGKKTITIQLEKGNNVIRLSNPSNWMPDIDYMELSLTNPSAINQQKVSDKGHGKTYDLLGRTAKVEKRGGILVNDGKKTLTKK